MTPPDVALVIAGHGSHRNPDSSRPAERHARAIRQTNAFAEVRTTFWKEEPSFREILRTVTSAEVYVVPLFMSGGYFVDRILPRELRLTADQTLDVDKRVRLADPVGTHPTMRQVILHRAESVTGKSAVGPDTALVVVGHGTERHTDSATSTYEHVERLRALDRFATVQALFMDEPPYIADLGEHVDAAVVVVVPLFVADGYHTREDIPAAISLDPDGHGGYAVPTTVNGQRRYYAGAVGTDPRMATVILERASQAGATIDPDILAGREGSAQGATRQL